MSGIVWLASYPKSGNTWFRVFLTNYLRDCDAPADINELDGGPIASCRWMFDEEMGVAGSDLTADEVLRYRPKVYRQVASRLTEPMFCKVHDAFLNTPEGDPVFCPEATLGAIYLIRNPLDVAPSYANHNGCDVARAVKMMGQPKHTLALGRFGLPNQLPQPMGTWSQHVTSWVDAAGLDVLVLRYEDMKADPEAAFRRAVRFAGLDDDPERVRKAIDFASFERVRAQESEHGFREKMPRTQSFFRKGQVGSWRDDMTVDLARQIVSDHPAVMRRFGYLDDALLAELGMAAEPGSAATEVGMALEPTSAASAGTEAGAHRVG